MLVPILQSVVGVVLILLGVDTAKTPPTTRGMLWLYRSLFAVLGLSMVTLGWIQFRNQKHEEDLAAGKIKELSARVVEASAPIPAAEHPAEPIRSAVDGNQINYQKKYSALLNELIGNNSIDPNLRERLLITKAQLGRENTGAPESVSNPELDAVQIARNKILPLFDYTIKTLAAISDEEARVKGDKSVSTYGGLPKQIMEATSDGSRPRRTVAEIVFQKNAEWDFRVDMAEKASPHYEASITLTCTGGFMLVRTVGDGVTTQVETTRGESFAHKAASGADAKTNLADAVGKLVAAELDAVSLKK